MSRSVSEFTTTTTATCDRFYGKQKVLAERRPCKIGVLEWCNVTMAGYALAAVQFCEWSFKTPPTCSPPTHTPSPSDLLMVHAVCGTHTVSVADR